MAIAIYQDLQGRQYWADSTSENTLEKIAGGTWVLYDATPGTPPPPPVDPFDDEVAERIDNLTSKTSVRLRAASVAAVEAEADVAPTGAWDFTTAPTVAGVPLGSGGGTTVSDASTTVKGIVELATTTETTTGTDTARAVTSAGVAAAIAPKAPYRAAPFAPPQAPITVVTACESGWAQVSGTVTHDTTVRASGNASVKVITQAGGAAGLGQFMFTAQDWSKSAFAMSLRFDDWSNVDLYMWLSTSGTFSQYYRVQLTPRLSTVPSGEFSEYTFTRGDFDDNSGSPDWSTVNGIRFQLYGTGGNDRTMWIDDVKRYPTPSQGAVSVGFDDGYDTVRTAGRIMDVNGIRGTVFVIPQLLGQSGYMTQADVDERAEAGWDICGHGDINLASMSLAAAEADVSATKRYLVDHGYKGADVFAYPNDGHNFAVRTMVAKYFSAARGLVGLGQTRAYVPRRRFQSAQPGLAWSVGQMTGAIDRARADNSWLPIAFHRNPATATAPTDVSLADFQSVIEYLAATKMPTPTTSEALADPDLPPMFQAPNGTRYRLDVDNTGALVTSAL